MKYIVILAVIIVVVRIEFFLGLIDRAAESVGPAPVEVDASDIKSGRETLPMKSDLSLKQSPKRKFLALVDDFQSNPLSSLRDSALEVLKENPTMFGQKLDPELEVQIFRGRDLLMTNDKEGIAFMLELMNVLQGENQLMMKRFLSLLMDINMEHFLSAYVNTKDTNCSIASLTGDPLSEDEVRNEIYDREAALKAFIEKEKADPREKALATNCLLVLGIEISKFPPPPATENLPDPNPGVSP